MNTLVHIKPFLCQNCLFLINLILKKKLLNIFTKSHFMSFVTIKKFILEVKNLIEYDTILIFIKP